VNVVLRTKTKLQSQPFMNVRKSETFFSAKNVLFDSKKIKPRKRCALVNLTFPWFVYSNILLQTKILCVEFFSGMEKISELIFLQKNERKILGNVGVKLIVFDLKTKNDKERHIEKYKRY
jgi:hypothetical protein